jgi:hypothetical protein
MIRFSPFLEVVETGRQGQAFTLLQDAGLLQEMARKTAPPAHDSLTHENITETIAEPDPRAVKNGQVQGKVRQQTYQRSTLDQHAAR